MNTPRSHGYNVVLVHNPNFSVTDLSQIRDFIQKKHSDVNVFIGPDSPVPMRMRTSLGNLQTLVFSPLPIKNFRPEGARIFCGRALAKDEQVELFLQHDIPTPKTQVLRESDRFDARDWGRYVILKPSHQTSWGGQGISLVRTDKVTFRPQSAFPSKHPGSLGPMMVQQFINAGKNSQDYRVVTMFGRPLYALKRTQLTPMPDLSGDIGDETIQGITTNSTSGEREVNLCYEEDVLEFAKRMYRIAPDAAFQGCDIRREEGSNRLFALEINSWGSAWNFSSPRAQKTPTINGIRREDQFGAFEIAADALVETVRNLADAQNPYER